MKSISYTLSYDQPLSHWLQIEMHIPAELIQSYKIQVQMPAWRPGRYSIQNYAANVRDFEVESSASVRWSKVGKDVWQINLINKVSDLKVRYQYYANQLDAGSTFLTDQMLYVSPINCLMYIDELINKPTSIQLKVPDSYKISTSLPREGDYFKAKDYYELSDSPFICSEQLTEYSYQILEYQFKIALLGKNVSLEESIIKDFREFTKYQISFWIEFPTNEYVFQVILLNYLHYHGVEHKNSSMNVFGPFEDLKKRDRYIDFIGLCSHELFHTWNVTRLRANEILPYDFSKENYLKSGFVAEGFTTYYGDLMLIRSKVITTEEYLEKFNKVLKRHFLNQGRYHNSIYTSSIELWLDGYENKTPARKVSIYVKGAIIAFIFDLWVRQHTSNKKSLDDVIKSMWNRFYMNNEGYDVDDVKELLSFLTSQDSEVLFNDLIYSTLPVEELLNEYLPWIGCELIEKYSDKQWEHQLGIVIDRDKIQLIDENSFALDFLSIGDQILEFNERSVEEYLADEASSKKTVTSMKVKRLGEERSVEIPQSTAKYFPYYEIRPIKKASPQQEEAFNKWLNISA